MIATRTQSAHMLPITLMNDIYCGFAGIRENIVNIETTKKGRESQAALISRYACPGI